MNSARAWVLVAIAAFVVSGCGTIANLSTGEPDLYGGVQKDIQLLQTPRTQPEGIGIRNLGQLVLFVDLPLCFVADTLTLPIAIYELQRGGARANTPDPVGGRGEGTTTPAAFHPDNGH
jgi:uncharacterized protein YceK